VAAAAARGEAVAAHAADLGAHEAAAVHAAAHEAVAVSGGEETNQILEPRGAHTPSFLIAAQ